MESLFTALINSSPGLAGTLITVVLFLRHIKEKDTQFLQDLDKRDEQINAVMQQSLKLLGQVSERMNELEHTLRGFRCPGTNFYNHHKCTHGDHDK